VEIISEEMSLKKTVECAKKILIPLKISPIAIRDQTIYTVKFRGIYTVGKHRNTVGCVGIIFRYG
jgi:hypothetical protein